MTGLRSLLRTVQLPVHVKADVLRLDLLHPVTGGNKSFKLKYNLQKAISSSHKTLLTFGGPYSNHIAATALSCKQAGIKSIGVIRGEEPSEKGETLQFAQSCGMRLLFLSRSDYGRKNEAALLAELHRVFGEFVMVPEGGANQEGMTGCAEMLNGLPFYDYVFCACGTGTTYAGLRSAKPAGTVLVGISVLKGANLLPRSVGEMMGTAEEDEVLGDEALAERVITRDCILSDYAFSGYARFDEELIRFKDEFESTHEVPLDHVYTVKLFYAVQDLLAKGKLRDEASILVIHSGGLQGNAPFERRYQRKLMR